MWERDRLIRQLDRLVDGMVALQHDGSFHEPNLDGTPGDYISFDGWEWPQGVGIYGLVRYWEFSGQDRHRQLVEAWYQRQLGRPLPKANVNTTAPMLALSILWDRTRDPRWKEPLERWAGIVMDDLPRTEEGGFQHIVSDSVNPGELWDDTLFMVGLFLASYGRAAGRRDLIDEAVRQFLLHTHYLTDRKTGLWYHGWTFEGRHNFAGALWARGNAWITAGLLDFIELGGIEGGVRDFLLGCLRTQAAALLRYQDKSGGWHTLVDDPTSYLEASATAGFGYGLLKGARLGILGEDAREAGLRALDYVLSNIDETGTLQNVSYGTRMGRNLQFYHDIPLQPTGYGQALAILLLAEAVRHTNDVELESA
ncbi:beta-galactosidase BglB [Microvirga puerhi]|uniref:Glycoside hydrolase family 88 protein n=1 Tax=Microvirga puerhi TaxID=2876078 RepID=A0ABS7VJ82_9HYPH|nr:glycoside hydrolase family 88 protein [Microvirga puerhi]MBZ6075557.1 glycoside hydrolase family 88 protein [Microvirga puerhi]